MAWCLDSSSSSGFKEMQEWIEEMAEYVKRIDKKHLLTVGLEGFYGPASPPEKTKVNPGKSYGELGSDFLRNSKTPDIDFASAHIYPDNWYTTTSKFYDSCVNDVDHRVLYTSVGWWTQIWLRKQTTFPNGWHLTLKMARKSYTSQSCSQSSASPTRTTTLTTHIEWRSTNPSTTPSTSLRWGMEPEQAPSSGTYWWEEWRSTPMILGSSQGKHLPSIGW